MHVFSLEELSFSDVVITIFHKLFWNFYQKAIERLQDGLWPSLIRVNYGVENAPVCDGMVEARGEGRGSFLGPSVRNRRIERLMRDIFRCMCHLFYYVFLRNGGYRPASR